MVVDHLPMSLDIAEEVNNYKHHIYLSLHRFYSTIRSMAKDLVSMLQEDMVHIPLYGAYSHMTACVKPRELSQKVQDRVVHSIMQQG